MPDSSSHGRRHTGPFLLAGLLATPLCSQQPLQGAPSDPWPDQRPEFEAIAESLLLGLNPYVGSLRLTALERRLAQGLLPAATTAQLRGELALEYLRLARPAEAEQAIERALLDAEEAGRVSLVQGLLERRVMIHLRRAELANCVALHNADCCLLPLAGDGVHSEPEHAEAARADLVQLLEQRPDNLALRWLYNVTSMATGAWPDGVEPAWRVPAEAFESEHELPRWRDRAPSLGVDVLNLCGGTVVEDLDGDGRLDIVTSSSDPREPLHYFASDGAGGYVERSAQSRLDEQLGGLNLIGGDYDSDGDFDLFVLRGAWLHREGTIRNSLLRNDAGVFRDVTRAAGLAEPAHPTQAACFGDLDGDADLDLFVGNEWRQTGRREDVHPSNLFLNDGAGVFEDVAEEAGTTNGLYAKGVCAGDYDNDGDLDLYVSNVGPNRLYRNEGSAQFVELAQELDVAEPVGRSFACWFFDVQNDGRLDLFVAGYESNVEDVCADFLGREHAGVPPRLYLNEQDGFRDVAPQMGLDRPWLPMGANFGDVDGDGWLDVYLATGDPNYSTLVPNVLLRNTEGVRFEDATTSAGLGHLQKGHGVAFADLDDDGDQDLYHQLGGFYLGDAYQNALFENPMEPTRWLRLRLVGVECNRSAVGARLKLVLDTPAGERVLHRAVGMQSSFGGSTLRQEIGLGDATALRRLEVRWPGAQEPQVFEGLPLDAELRLTQGRAEAERVERAPLVLGGG